VGLSVGRPGPDEVDSLLGLCEYTRGRPDAAVRAWSRVPPMSRHGGLALYYRARLFIQRGRLTEAESLLRSSLRTTGAHGDDARWELVKLLRLEGRFEEARRVYFSGITPQPDIPARLFRQNKTQAAPLP